MSVTCSCLIMQKHVNYTLHSGSRRVLLEEMIQYKDMIQVFDSNIFWSTSHCISIDWSSVFKCTYTRVCFGVSFVITVLVSTECGRGKQKCTWRLVGQGGREEPLQDQATPQGGPACPLLGFPLWKPAESGGWDLRHLWIRPECCGMQGECPRPCGKKSEMQTWNCFTKQWGNGVIICDQ